MNCEPAQIDVEAIARRLEQMGSAARVSNISVALRLNGMSHYWSTAASAETAPRFPIGCITKMLVSAAALELNAAHVLDIDRPIGDYLSELHGTTIGRLVPVSSLLSDTAGYCGFALSGPETWNDLVAALASAPQIFAPGTVCNPADHSGHVLLGEIIGRASGRSWIDVVDETIGVPAFGRSLFNGMDRLWVWSAAAARTRLLPEELAQLGEVLMTGRVPSTGNRILSEATVARLSAIVVRMPARIGEGRLHWAPEGYGLGLPTFHSGLRGQCGKEPRAMSSVRFLASAGMALAVCMESGNPFLRHEVLDFVLSELGIPVPPREDRLALEFSPEELVGEYVGLRGFKVSVEYDHPSIRILVAGEGGGVAAYSCRVNDDATVSIDPGQKVIALAFFPDPSTRAPCVTIGLHSLRQDRPPRA